MKNIIKRVVSLVLCFVLCGAMIIPLSDSSFAASGTVRHISFSTKPGVKSIKLRWKKQSDVSCYKIYRKDVTGKKIILGTDIPFSTFKKIAKVSGKTKVYRDKSVKTGHTYAYVLIGYKKESGKLKKVCSSWNDGVLRYDTAGLCKPDLLNGGRGEFYSNSKAKIYLFVQLDSGMSAKGVIVYRKAKGESKFKKIKVKTLEDGTVLLDKNVKANKVYYYKVRTWIRKSGKKYTSKASNVIKIKAAAPAPDEL